MASNEKKKKELSKEEQAQEDKNKAEVISDIPKIIATINTRYASDKCRSKVEKLKKEGKFWEAVNAVKPRASESGEEYILSYNSSTEGLEPVYFWILDFMETLRLKPKKLVDNFSSSPGSGHFSELMGKGTRMQEESMKVMQTIGVLIKSVINIIYDLRQFEIRLNDYDAANSKNKNEAEAGLMALKQVWMDNVDIKRGNTSIKGMAFSQASFATLIDAFMMAKSLDDISGTEEKKGLDLNERVKNILKQRFIEFEQWKTLSEKELRKRYSIQKSWLKSQVDSIKLYSRWAKPYLKAAEELRMNTGLSSDAAMVKTFNTMILQLTLMGVKGIDVSSTVIEDKALPKGFEKLDEKKKIRTMNSCVLADFKFRGIPQRVDQHYAFGGKADVTFRSYALSEEELTEFYARLEESDVNEAMKLVENATDTSLKEIQEDIDYFLSGKEAKDDKNKKEGKTEQTEEEKQDINPFSAIVNFSAIKDMFEKTKYKSAKREKGEEIKPDNYAESVVRKLAAYKAKGNAFTIYDVYKKSHGMASAPFGDLVSNPVNDQSVNFSDIFKRNF
ncbi:MAG: hypothetical protein Q8L27_01430 [archaeon]|nr:hypothetical protein [archaeon]